jgi:hypothetical protein
VYRILSKKKVECPRNPRLGGFLGKDKRDKRRRKEAKKNAARFSCDDLSTMPERTGKVK